MQHQICAIAVIIQIGRVVTRLGNAERKATALQLEPLDRIRQVRDAFVAEVEQMEDVVVERAGIAVEIFPLGRLGHGHGHQAPVQPKVGRPPHGELQIGHLARCEIMDMQNLVRGIAVIVQVVFSVRAFAHEEREEVTLELERQQVGRTSQVGYGSAVPCVQHAVGLVPI